MKTRVAALLTGAAVAVSATASQAQNQGNPPAITASLVGELIDNTSLNGAAAVAVSGNYAYVVGYNIFTVVDLTQPGTPQVVGSVTNSSDIGGGTGSNGDVASVFIAGNYAYVGTIGIDKLIVIDISNPHSPAIVGALTASNFGTTDNPTIYVAGRYAYVNSGRCIGQLSVVDISQPANPVLAGSANWGNSLPGGNCDAFENTMLVQGRYAYIAVGDAGVANQLLLIYDLSNPASPSFVGQTEITPVSAGDFPVSLAVDGRYAYVGGDFNTVWVIDVSNPASPIPVAYDPPAPSSTPGCGRSLAKSGSYLYAPAYFTYPGLCVYNVANPTAAPVLVSNALSPFGTSGGIADGLTSIALHGHYVVTLVHQQNALLVYNIGGLDLTSANVGSLRSGRMQVTGDANFYNSVWAQGGLNVGLPGLASNGPVSAPSMLTQAGTGTGAIQPEGALAVNTTVTANGADTTEDTLASISIPANTLSAVGKCLRVRAQVAYASNSDNKTARLYFGSEVIATPSAATSGGSGWLELIACKTASNAQRVTGTGQVGTTPVTPLTTTGAEADTSAITVKLTGQAGTANANDIQSNLVLVEALN